VELSLASGSLADRPPRWRRRLPVPGRV